MPIHCMSLPILAEIQTFHYAITRPWRGLSKPLYSMTWKIGHFDNIAEYVCVCDSYITAATKASSVFTKFIFSGFCPNETSALKKQAENKRWRVKRPIWQQVSVSGAYMQDWLAEWAVGVADWWLCCCQGGELMEKNWCVDTGVDGRQAVGTGLLFIPFLLKIRIDFIQSTRENKTLWKHTQTERKWHE